MHPLEIGAVPVELSPLVDAINEYAMRLERHTSVQQSFIQNAAHQLRTPLTLLTTQVSYAVRASDAAGRSESLSAIRQTVQQSVRLVNQLLTLSSAEVHGPGELQGEEGRLDEVVRGVLVDMAGRAQSKRTLTSEALASKPRAAVDFSEPLVLARAGMASRLREEGPAAGGFVDVRQPARGSSKPV